MATYRPGLETLVRLMESYQVSPKTRVDQTGLCGAYEPDRPVKSVSRDMTVKQRRQRGASRDTGVGDTLLNCAGV